MPGATKPAWLFLFGGAGRAGKRSYLTAGSKVPAPAIPQTLGDRIMSLGFILLIVLIVFLLGGFSGRFGGYGYGYGHRGIGVLGTVLIIVVVLMLLGRI